MGFCVWRLGFDSVGKRCARSGDWESGDLFVGHPRFVRLGVWGFICGSPEVCNVDDEREEDDSLEAGNYSNDPPQVSARVYVPVPVCQDRRFRV
jgi:hypothetical protein